jgi:predicted RNase H-like HicB family nuclease
VTRIVHVPYVVEQDEDGVWCASAQLRPGVGAVGDGPSPEAAVADLRGALETLLAEVGPPDELTLTLARVSNDHAPRQGVSPGRDVFTGLLAPMT